MSHQDPRRTADTWPAHRAKRKRRQARKRALKGLTTATNESSKEGKWASPEPK